jgi:regulator of protease activity HflC (stomatin/prohibitin superfamily)
MSSLPPNDLPPQDAPYAEESGDEDAAPRRAASAQFVVETEVGSAARMREAMDPANQSLRDALRLSYRVLQFVMLVLVVLFIGSGFKVVEDGQTGVMLRWGKILEKDGHKALEPGPKFSRWPYPAGEFVLFTDQGRAIDLGTTYWPYVREGRTLEETIAGANVRTELRPGPGGEGDGYVLTAGGDIAHLKLSTSYDIDDPVRYVHAVEDRNSDPGALDGDKLVELAVARAAVHASAQVPLETLLGLDEVGKDEIRGTAQAMLDAVESGIRIGGVDAPADPMPALAIKNKANELQEIRSQVGQQLEFARQQANTLLIDTVGSDYEAVLDLLEAYQTARSGGDELEIQTTLTALTDELKDDATSGRAHSVLEQARAYRTQIASTLGRELDTLRSYLPAYRENPRVLVSRLWLEAYAEVVGRADADVHFVPADLSMVSLGVVGSRDVREQRRKDDLAEREREGRTSVDLGGGALRLDEIGQSRRLKKDASSAPR